jgi:hypothetical protein
MQWLAHWARYLSKLRLILNTKFSYLGFFCLSPQKGIVGVRAEATAPGSAEADIFRSDQRQLAQRGIARPLCLPWSDQESPSHETRGKMALKVPSIRPPLLTDCELFPLKISAFVRRKHTP